MIRDGVFTCPDCGGELKHYDSVLRIVRTKGRSTEHVRISRRRCVDCGHTHRVLPAYLYPYKQYEVEVIYGVLEGIITPDTYGFEEYPEESTMRYWKRNLSTDFSSQNSSC